MGQGPSSSAVRWASGQATQNVGRAWDGGGTHRHAKLDVLVEHAWPRGQIHAGASATQCDCVWVARVCVGRLQGQRARHGTLANAR